jgi:hypothetical protein
MKATARFLTRSITSQRFDVQAGRVACWLVSVAVLILGCLTLARLELTEVELFLGLLLVLTVSLLSVLLGLVLPMAADHDRRSKA